MKNSLLNSLMVMGAVLTVIGCGGGSTLTGEEEVLPPISELPSSTLSEELKDTITYMYNEESLAYDVYLNVNKELVAKYDINVSTLHNIATKSESEHMQKVDTLASTYDLNMSTYDPTLEPYSKESIGDGKYSVSHVQELYDLLYTKGIKSEREALEVGCMVEVVDIADLDEYILLAQKSKASDVLSVFYELRQGSYNHYWKFNEALKKLNDPIGLDKFVGCCSVADYDIYNFCHIDDYPSSTNGN
ncbi:DUF2202 domain-containing protein [Sulfurovum sp.]|uniref:DUF2202 domain-containing protein n=1 Tax=Sulfurovum sp. TaxID=1969726 RepID=UPI00356A4539